MATYLYRCDKGHEWELQAQMGTAPETVDCGGSPESLERDCLLKAKRLYLPAAVAFKGSGFYRTDNPKLKHVSTTDR